MIKELPDYDQVKAVAPSEGDADDCKRNSPALNTGEPQSIMNNSIADSTTNAGFGQLPPEQFDTEYLRLIASDIKNARAHRHEMPAEAKRGLTDETIEHFDLGYLPEWILTKSRAQWNCGLYVKKDTGEMKQLPPASRRIIIPTDDGEHFNAVALPSDRKHMDKKFWKQHAGAKKLFGDKKSVADADIVIVVEGEFDAASIWQCSGGKIAAVAILGCSNANNTLMPNLKSLLSGKKLLLLLDGDQSGREASEDLRGELIKRAVPAVSRYLTDFNSFAEGTKQLGDKVDCNDILRKHGNEFLKSLLDRIIDDARADFIKAEQEAAQQNLFERASTDNEHPEINASQAREAAETAAHDNSVKDAQNAPQVTAETIATARAALKEIPVAQTTEPDWLTVIWAGKASGLTLEELDTWSRNDTRYDSAKVDCNFNRYDPTKTGKGGKPLSVASLVAIARKFNPDFKAPKKPAKLPIELVLPSDVEFQGNSIVIVGGTPDKPKYFTAARSLILPTRKIVNDGGGNLRYEVAIRSPRGKWTRTVVDMRALLEPSKVYALSEQGANVANAKLLASYFSKLLALPENEDIIPTVTIFNRPGWHGDKFIYPTPTDSENYRVERSGIDYESIFKTCGDKDKWLLKFWDIVNGKQQGELKRIVLGACMVAPMLKVIKIPNPQFNLWGTSNFAKTPLPKFGLSIYGDPSEGAMFRTWNATAKNMLTMSAGFNCLPLLIDEGETMSRKTQAELSEYVYNFSIGIIGQANKRNGDVRATEKFHGVRFSTAERPLHDTADKRGAYKRLIDIHVTEPLFTDSYARQLHIFCEGNFGHFGRQWTKYIADNKDAIRADFDRTENFFAENGFKRDGIQVAYSSVDATNGRSVTACAVAYQHFCACLGLEDKFQFCDARDDAAAILAELPTVDEIDDVKRGIELLASWVAEHPRQFITPAKVNGEEIDGLDEPAQSFTVTVGKKFTDGSIAFFANAFRNIVDEIGLPSYEKFLCDLYDADYLDCPNSREKAKQIRNGKSKVRAYVLKAGTFEAEDDDKN